MLAPSQPFPVSTSRVECCEEGLPMEPERGTVWPFMKVAAWWDGPCCVSTGAAVLSQPNHMEILHRGDFVDTMDANNCLLFTNVRKMALDDQVGWLARQWTG